MVQAVVDIESEAETGDDDDYVRILDSVSAEILLPAEQDEEPVPLATFQCDPGLELKVIYSWYCAEFGKAIKNSCLLMSQRTVLPKTISYTISIVPRVTDNPTD